MAKDDVVQDLDVRANTAPVFDSLGVSDDLKLGAHWNQAEVQAMEGFPNDAWDAAAAQVEAGEALMKDEDLTALAAVQRKSANRNADSGSRNFQESRHVDGEAGKGREYTKALNKALDADTFNF